MKTSFKTASIWGILWRFFLLSNVLGLVLSFLIGMLFPFSPPVWTGLLLNLTVYGSLFFVIKKRVQGQNFSWDAFTGRNTVDLKLLLKIGVMTLVVVAAANSFSYFFLFIVNLSEFLTQLVRPYFAFMATTDAGLSKFNIFITGVIAAPIVEETFFRGFLLNKWAEKYKTASAIFWSSFIFMIIHIPSLFIPQFLIGLLCALVYIKTKQLIYPIFAHAFYNFVVVMPLLFSTEEALSYSVSEELNALFNPDPQTMQLFISGTIIFLAALTLLIVLFKKFGNNINQEPAPYSANIEEAPDFIAFERKERTLEKAKEKKYGTTEEEWLAFNDFIYEEEDDEEDEKRTD